MTAKGETRADGRVAALAAAHFLAFVDRFLIAATAPILALRFHLSDGWLGLLLGPAFALPYGIAAILFGRRSDAGGARLLVLAGIGTWTIGSAMVAVSTTAPMLLAARAIVGLGQAAFVPAALLLVLGGAGADRRAQALALFTIGSSAGRSAGLLVAGGILAGLAALGIAVVPDGWRWLFVVSAVPNIVLLLVLARIIPHRPAVSIAAAPTPRWRPGISAAIFMAGAVAPILIGQSVAAWLPVLLARGHGLSTAQAATLAGALTLVAAPCGQIAGGVLMARSARARAHPATVVAGALTLACAFLFVAGNTVSLIGVVTGMTAFTLVAGVSSFAALFGIQAIMPASRRGTGNGLFIALVTLVGAGAGPALTGLFSGWWQAPGGRSLDHALATTAAIAVTIAVVAAIANRTRYPRAAAAFRT